jgi:hypothetical protein
MPFAPSNGGETPSRWAGRAVPWREHAFDILLGLGNTAQDILTLARLHLSNAEAEALTVWIAHRVGRAQALAGDRGAYGRLEHVVRHWLSKGERSALLCRLMRRISLGQAPVPEAAIRPPRQPPGAAPTP